MEKQLTLPNSYPAIVADMLSDAIGCIGFSWIASPACTGHLIFLWIKKKRINYQKFKPLKLPSTQLKLNFIYCRLVTDLCGGGAGIWPLTNIFEM